MRIDLRDGQWAELRERITHGDDKAIKRAYVKGRQDGDVFDAQTFMVRAFVKAWEIRDLDGSPLALDDPTSFERIPDDIADMLFIAAADLYKGSTVPNPPTPDSSGG